MRTNIPTESQSIQAFRQKLESIADRNRVGCGWFRFTCSVHHLDYWRERIRFYFRAELASRGRGWNGYLQSETGAYSIIIGFTPFMSEQELREQGLSKASNEGLMTVDIPQTAMDSLSAASVRNLWLNFYGCEGAKLTRVDLYYDDYCKLVSPEKVHSACRGGGVGVPRIKNIRLWDEWSLQDGLSRGTTVYFGSPRSGKMIRLYDKFAESGGKQDCYRWEVELKKHEARAFQQWFITVLSEALDAPTDAASVEVITNGYKSVLKSCISFHDIPEGKMPNQLPANWAARSPVTWWWRELLAGLEPAKLVVERVQPSLERSIFWLLYQVMPVLALVKAVLEYWGIPWRNWLDRGLEQGHEKWGNRHFKLLEQSLMTSPAT